MRRNAPPTCAARSASKRCDATRQPCGFPPLGGDIRDAVASQACPGPDSNRQGPIRIRRILSPLRLPISPPGRSRSGKWRPGSESNRRTRLCRPLHDHSATWPLTSRNRRQLSVRCRKNKTSACPRFRRKSGAGNETRTRDPDLGKVVLYQLSYSRASRTSYDLGGSCQPRGHESRASRISGQDARR